MVDLTPQVVGPQFQAPKKQGPIISSGSVTSQSMRKRSGLGGIFAALIVMIVMVGCAAVIYWAYSLLTAAKGN